MLIFSFLKNHKKKNLRNTKTIKNRRAFSLKFKQRALRELANNNNNFQNKALRLGISRQCLMNWKKQTDKILEANHKTIRQRVPQNFDRALFQKMEKVKKEEDLVK